MGFLRRLEDAEHEAEDRAVKVLISKFDSADDRVAMQAAQWWLARRRKVCWAEQKDAVEPPTEEECRALVEKIRGTGT
jgi:hypothetical protein